MPEWALGTFPPLFQPAQTRFFALEPCFWAANRSKISIVLLFPPRTPLYHLASISTSAKTGLMLAKTAPKWPFFGLYRPFFASISASPPTPLDARKRERMGLCAPSITEPGAKVKNKTAPAKESLARGTSDAIALSGDIGKLHLSRPPRFGQYI